MQWSEHHALALMQLYSWELRGYAGNPEFRGTMDAKYEARGWVGRTVTNFSKQEYHAFRYFGESTENVYCSPRDNCGGERAIEHFIGDYEDSCINLWMQLDNLKAFEELLDSFPKRESILIFKDPKAKIPSCMKSTNYLVHRGTDGMAIAYTAEVNPNKAMILRLQH